MSKVTKNRTVQIDGMNYSLPTHVYWRESSRCFEYRATVKAVRKTKLFGEEYPDVDAAYRAAIAFAKKTDKPAKGKTAARTTGNLETPSAVVKPEKAAKVEKPVREFVVPEVSPYCTLYEASVRMGADLAQVEAAVKANRLKHERTRTVDGKPEKLYIYALVKVYAEFHAKEYAKIQEDRLAVLRVREEEREKAVVKAVEMTTPEKMLVVLNDVGNAITALFRTVNQVVAYTNAREGRDQHALQLLESIALSANGNGKVLANQMNRLAELTARLEMRLGIVPGDILGDAFSKTMGQHKFTTVDQPQPAQSGTPINFAPEEPAPTKVTELDPSPVGYVAQTPVEQPPAVPKPVLKKVAIVGVPASQVAALEREYGQSFDLHFFPADKASGSGFRAQLMSCCAVFALMSNLNSGISDLRSAAGKNLVPLQGGVSGLRTELTKFVLGQQKHTFPHMQPGPARI